MNILKFLGEWEGKVLGQRKMTRFWDLDPEMSFFLRLFAIHEIVILY